MKVDLTAADLIKFEEEIIDLFLQKKILAPIHLDSNNEEQLIHIFKDYVDEGDWICCSWRSHYRCLLQGVPQDKMKEAILLGRSISLCFPEYRVISSGIVGGTVPIAVGLAMGIKRRGEKRKVVAFVGDMTSETGGFHECYKYCNNHNLPILWVVEDNNKSVCTPTRESWGLSYFCHLTNQVVPGQLSCEPDNYDKMSEERKINGVVYIRNDLLYYKYESKFPHAGGGQRIQF